MSILFGRSSRSLSGPSMLTTDGRIVPRGTSRTTTISADQALRSSAVWACLRLRADLVSCMPVDTYRTVQGTQVESPKPPVLVTPGGEEVAIDEHMYSSQFDLDRAGNAFGIITERDGDNTPARIDLQAMESATVRTKDGVRTYKFGASKWYDAVDVWHEKQYTTSGSPVGLSPIAYAAMGLQRDLSALEFAMDWFANGSVPPGRLKNVEKTINRKEAAGLKAAFKEAVRNREVFVHGKDWDYEMLSVSANESQFLETMAAGVPDVCRFLGVPADMIDADKASGTITYANITQRNLQLLILNLGPAIQRRERALSRLAGPGRFVKLNTDAILRMDPKAREEMLGKQVSDRTLAPSEARALSNRPPFTPDQLAEFALLFPNKAPALAVPTPNGVPA